MTRAVTCKDFVEFLDDYLSGALSLEQREAFNAHLAICPSCVAYMKSYRDAVRLGRAALTPADEPVPREVPEELVQAILSARGRKA